MRSIGDELLLFGDPFIYPPQHFVVTHRESDQFVFRIAFYFNLLGKSSQLGMLHVGEDPLKGSKRVPYYSFCRQPTNEETGRHDGKKQNDGEDHHLIADIDVGAEDHEADNAFFTVQRSSDDEICSAFVKFLELESRTVFLENFF